MKQKMEYKRSWLFLMPSFILVICLTAYCRTEPEPKSREGLLLKSVYDILQGYHYSPQNVNDDFSQTVFKEYLLNLDAGKRLFTSQDLKLLESERMLIDDQFKNGETSFFDKSNDLMDKALEKAESYFYSFIDMPFVFKSEENISLDEEIRPYAKDDAELKDFWRKSIQYELMSRYYDDKKNLEKENKTKPADSLEIDIRKEVKDNFEGWFKRMKEFKRNDRFEIYLNTLTHQYDPHTDYLSPKDKEDFNINMTGKLEGIGARLQTDREYTKVVSIVPGGPAWKQKDLENNDLILSVQQKDQNPVDIKGMVIDDVVKMIRGKKGTIVTLKVKKSSGVVKDITITRDEVIMDEGFARSAIIGVDSLLSHVGYIKLPRFYADFDNPNGPSAAKDIANELKKLKAEGATSLILDLRNNGGGSLQEVVEMAGLFIEEGPIVQVRSRGNISPYMDPDPSVHFDGPMVILVNSNSASASEIIAACLQDYKRAVILGGESTFGKGTVQRFVNLDRTVNQNVIQLASGGDPIAVKPLGEVKITIQKYYSVNGGSVRLKGVEPDVLVPNYYTYLDNGEKEYEHPMPYDVIKKENYVQNVFSISNLDEIKAKSKDRIKNNPTYSLIDENAKRLKSLRDQQVFPLNYDRFAGIMKERNELAKKFENLGKDVIPHLKSTNLQSDMDYINMDSSRVGRNEDFLKSISKDQEILESIYVLNDVKKQK